MLFIGVFPRGAPLRFYKHTLFARGAPGGHCVSAVEALDGDPRATTLLGFEDRIERHERVLAGDEIQVDAAGYGARAPGVVVSGVFPKVDLALDDPRITASTSSGDPFLWIHVPRVLTYWTAFGELRFEDARKPGAVEGLGLVEHAFGAAIPVDLGRVPVSWQWDVLRLDQGGFGAGLAISIGGRLRGIRGVLEIGEDAGVRTSSSSMSWRESGHEEGRAVPLRWSGALRTGAGELVYEARRATPVSPEVPDGGFLGFEFEGFWRSKGARERRVSGTGFSEYRARSS
jgi:hypothetical protein